MMSMLASSPCRRRLDQHHERAFQLFGQKFNTTKLAELERKELLLKEQQDERRVAEAAAASQQLSKPPLPVDFAAEAALAGAVGEADLSGGRPADAAYFTFNGRCFITFFTKSRWILGELG